jgi:hypothetical protein
MCPCSSPWFCFRNLLEQRSRCLPDSTSTSSSVACCDVTADPDFNWLHKEEKRHRETKYETIEASLTNCLFHTQLSEKSPLETHTKKRYGWLRLVSIRIFELCIPCLRLRGEWLGGSSWEAGTKSEQNPGTLEPGCKAGLLNSLCQSENLQIDRSLMLASPTHFQIFQVPGNMICVRCSMTGT